MTTPIGQRTDILNKIVNVVLDANGNGRASIGPAVGEYWAPLLIRVTTASANTPVPTCVVYHGAINDTSRTAYLDDTASGNNDTSSIIAGVTVQNGETISAVWSNGNPGDNATLIINGTTTNQPPSVGQLPSVPGTHFAGKLSTEVVSELSKVVSASPVLLVASSVLTVPTTFSFDVRQYNSYSFVMLATPVAETQSEPIQVQLIWSETAAGNNVFVDEVEIFANGPFISTLDMQDQMHGPYLKFVITNNSLADSVNISYVLLGSTRVIPQPSYKQTAAVDGIVYNTGLTSLVAGAKITRGFLSVGRTWFVFNNQGANSMNFNINWGSVGSNILVTVPANTTTNFETILPKRAPQVTVFGTGTQNFTVQAITQYDKES